MNDVYVKSGTRYRKATGSEVCEAASSYVFHKTSKVRPVLSTPKETRTFLAFQGGVDHEQFGVVFLDNRHRMLAVEILFTGTIDGASVHPREVIKKVMGHSAAAVIFFHNHPSGISTPSRADEMITSKLKGALEFIDVRVLDHVILAGDDFTSMAEVGLL